ncbi:facilitated trehalose transporter Tret1-like [Epargyreus clarus]|uniref:facilitated trehalose transporter Tret1-like n=1 Tax=Epargyreus clarus TaxID=520877 RepID=UPI003C2CF940
MDLLKTPLTNQLFVVSGIYSAIVSCGLGLGYPEVSYNSNDLSWKEPNIRYAETVGEISFVLSVFLIPYFSDKRGRKMANVIATLSLLLSWIIRIFSLNFLSHIIINVLFNIGLGGTVAISSVIISEYCSPKYRSAFLLLETAAISFGILLSHTCNIFSETTLISTFGMLFSGTNLVMVNYWPESPYWLISQDHFLSCMEAFCHLHGTDEEASKELKLMLETQKIKLQLEALKPVRRLKIRERIKSYMRSLLKAEFLRPLSIAILLFTFIGFGGENVAANYAIRDIFNLNKKYIGTIVLDVLSLICSLTACVLIQIVKRKTLFMFTGSCSVMFLALISLFLSLKSFNLISQDYIWLYLTWVTGFSMFMSLGTTALPFSILGEIFPMSYKGIGNSVTCAYFWAFGNSLFKLVPWLAASIGMYGVFILSITFMTAILLIVNNILPETSILSLVEIEKLFKVEGGDISENVVGVAEPEENTRFDGLKLLIE